MKIEIQRNNDVVNVSVEGNIEIDLIKDLRSQLLDIAQNDNKNIEINLSQSGYMDSTGVGMLLHIYKIQKKKGKSIKLINVSPRIKNIIEQSNLSDVFSVDK
jgi:anti-sigma B factor antagonist